MFQHIGMLTLLPTASAENADAIVDGLSQLVGIVPGLLSADIAYDAGLVEGNASLYFCMSFDDESEWRAYRVHPAHVAVAHDLIGPVLQSKTFLQRVADAASVVRVAE